MAHLFIRQFGEDEGHVGMAKVILQRLPAHALRLFQAEAQQILVLLEGQVPEVTVRPLEPRLLVGLQGAEVEQMLLADMGEVEGRYPGRHHWNDVVDIGVIVKIRIGFPIVPFPRGLVVRRGEGIHKACRVIRILAAQTADHVRRGCAQAVTGDKQYGVVPVRPFKAADIRPKGIGAVFSALIEPVGDGFDIRNAVRDRRRPLEHRANRVPLLSVLSSVPVF